MAVHSTITCTGNAGDCLLLSVDCERSLIYLTDYSESFN